MSVRDGPDGVPDEAPPHFTLFVNGASRTSALAVTRLRGLCNRYYPDGYQLEVIDINQQPALVTARSVVAVPTLFRDLPDPMRILVGDLQDESRVLAALELSPGPGETPP